MTQCSSQSHRHITVLSSFWNCNVRHLRVKYREEWWACSKPSQTMIRQARSVPLLAAPVDTEGSEHWAFNITQFAIYFLDPHHQQNRCFPGSIGRSENRFQNWLSTFTVRLFVRRFVFIGFRSLHHTELASEDRLYLRITRYFPRIHPFAFSC